MREKNYVLIKLHHDYDISFTAVFERKYNQQYVDFFRVLKRIDRLVYRFDLFAHWRIHSVLFIIQLKSTSISKNDSFQRFKSDHSKSIKFCWKRYKTRQVLWNRTSDEQASNETSWIKIFNTLTRIRIRTWWLKKSFRVKRRSTIRKKLRECSSENVHIIKSFENYRI